MTPREERSAQTRAALLLAARRVFAEKGYQGTNVADIVAAADRGRGTFYLHFENKQAIFAALLDEVIDRMVAQARVIWRADQPAHSVLVSVMTFFEDFCANRDLWALFDEITATERDATGIRDRWLETFSARVRRGIESAPATAVHRLDQRVMAELLAHLVDETARILAFEGGSHDPGVMALHVATLWSRTLGFPEEELTLMSPEGAVLRPKRAAR